MGSWRIGNGWDFPCLLALPAPCRGAGDAQPGACRGLWAAEAPALQDLSIQAGGQAAETPGCHAILQSQLPGGLGPPEKRLPLTEA